MSNTDKWQQVVDLLRSWGRTVKEQPGCWGKNNGLDWNYGDQIGHINHHFVCGTDPAQAQNYVDMLVNGYGETPPPIVNTFIDVLGNIYLISTGPANHSGQGNTAVMDRVRNDQAPLGPAAQVAPGNNFTGNAYYSGTETQHPGDGTPYADALIDALVDLNAALAIVFGWTSNRAIMHYEHTDRKEDMSWRGSVNGDGGPELRRRVAARIAQYKSGTVVVPGGDDEMSQKEVDEIKAAISDLANKLDSNQNSLVAMLRPTWQRVAAIAHSSNIWLSGEKNAPTGNKR